MRYSLPRLILVSTLIAAGCSAAGGPGLGAGGAAVDVGGSGGTREGSGGSGSGGSGSGGGPGGVGSGGAGGDPVTLPDASAPDADAGGPVTDVSGQAPPDAGMININGEIPPYEGPPVGPEVTMDCPGDPTVGFTEYKDTFHVERPYDLPVSARFSFEGGIYNFWVMNGDKRHDPASTATNPRTEARYSENFRTGIRMFNADVFWEKSVTSGTVVMQVHTTATGIGPVYLVANGANVPPINGARVPGGLIDRWINLKVLINADTTASQYWINNCPVASMGSGTRGDGNDYFKIGVYHCDAGTCRARVKNIHLFKK